MSKFFHWYNAKLASSPLITNIFSTGALFGIGDMVAQQFAPDPSGKFDYGRCGKAMFYGGCIFAPIGTKWYPLIAKIKGSTPTLRAAKTMATDQLVFSPFVGIPLYFACMGFMNGKRDQELVGHLKRNYTPTLLTNWTVWPAVQFVNFLLVPVQLRLLVVNVVSIFWNTFLSLQNASGPHKPEPY